MTAVLGVVGIVGTVFGKNRLEKANANRLDACQKQLALVQSADQADSRKSATSWTAGFRAAADRWSAGSKRRKRIWRELEELVPLETRRNAAVQSATAAEERAAQAEEEYKAARRKWRDSLSAAGLPVELSTRQVRQLAGRWSSMSENQRRLAQRREELDRRRKEWDALAARLAQVAADANVALPRRRSARTVEATFGGLGRASKRPPRGGKPSRDELKQLRQLRARHEEAIGRLNHRRRSLFFEAGAEDEEAFRQKAVQAVRAETLRSERESLDRDIAAAIGKQCTEEAIGELLEERPGGGVGIARQFAPRSAGGARMRKSANDWKNAAS